jgi:hypothetical protein
MNQSSQLDRHPDAESLSAFAEHALPEQEHKQLLSHLAECGRCREILYLAQESAGEVETPAFQTAPVLRNRYSASWFANWRFVWVPAAVCVAIAVTVVQIHFWRGKPDSGAISIVDSRKSEPALTIGSVSPPVPAAHEDDEPRQTSIAAKPSLDASKSAGFPKNLPQTQPTPVIENFVVREVPPEELKKKSAGAPSPSAMQNASGTQNASGQAVSGTMTATTVEVQSEAPLLTQESPISSTLSAAKVQSMPLDGRNLSARQKTSFARAGAAGRQKTAVAPQPVVRSGADTIATQGTAESPSHFTVSKSPAPLTKGLGQSAANFSVAAPSISAADEFAARAILFSRLPNGLTAISTAAAHGHLLAIDPAGEVFLSDDYGKTWRSVEQTWKGQAVQVLAVQAPTPQTTEGGPIGSFASAQAPAPVPSDAAVCPTCSRIPKNAPAPVFEMVTKTGAVWISNDGETWTLKEP